MSGTANIRIRPMGLGELAMVIDWAAEEGWNPGLGDAAAFHASDPEGFFLAEVGGEPVAAISVVNHSDDFAFLGLYLCRPLWRGRGIGLAVWRHGLAHAGTRSVGLDGVAAQEANYARSGFLRTGATIRFQGWHTGSGWPGMRPARPEDLPELLALDRAAAGVARERFLAAWLVTVPDRVTFVIEGADGRIVAFATARACRNGCKLGPVIAPDAETTLALLGSSPFHGPNIVDVPEGNGSLIDVLDGLGYRETFRTARMYRGQPPWETGRQQAIATMELG